MAKELADVGFNHEHNWNGTRLPKAGSWTPNGDGTKSRATWSTVLCTCGKVMGDADYSTESKG